MGNVRFGVSFGVDADHAKHSKVDYIAYQKDKAGAELGRKILEEKGLIKHKIGDLEFHQQELYVFTFDELKKYIEENNTRKSNV